MAILNPNPRVTARNAGRIEHYGGISVSPDDVLAFAKRGAPAFPCEPADGTTGVERRRHGFATKRVSEAMNGSDEP